MRAADYEIKNLDKLDRILVKLCSMVIEGQKSRPEFFGMVAACVLDPNNNIVAGLNYYNEDTGDRVHAERAAMEAYQRKYGQIPRGSIIVTTCSPCSEHMEERDGPSCTDLVNHSTVRKVYCGYLDPTQDEDQRTFTLQETNNPQIRELCEMFASTFIDDELDEDRHPNDRPYGPETKPTMPKGTVRVDVSDVYDWYKLGMHISDLKNADKSIFGKGPPSTIFSFGSEQEEHEYIKQLEKLGLTTTDIDPLDPDQPRGMPRQKVDPTFNVNENFADGRVKGKSRPGRVRRAGASCNGSVTDLRKRAKNASGEKAKMYHWCANMKSGRQK